LDATEGATGGAGHRLREQRLSHTGNVVDEQVTAGEECDHREADRFGLAAEYVTQPVAQGRGEVVRNGQVGVGARVGTHHAPVCRRIGAVA